MSKRMFALLLTGLMAIGILAAVPASAGGDREVIRTGGCSGGTDWKYKAKADDGRIEVEYEVDQNRNGDRWRVKLFHDGNRFFKGTRVTGGCEWLVRHRAQGEQPPGRRQISSTSSQSQDRRGVRGKRLLLGFRTTSDVGPVLIGPTFVFYFLDGHHDDIDQAPVDFGSGPAPPVRSSRSDPHSSQARLECRRRTRGRPLAL